MPVRCAEKRDAERKGSEEQPAPSEAKRSETERHPCNITEQAVVRRLFCPPERREKVPQLRATVGCSHAALLVFLHFSSSFPVGTALRDNYNQFL